MKKLKYKKDISKTIIDGQELTFINLTPIYTEEEQQKVKEEIEIKLFEVLKNMYKLLKKRCLY